MKINLTYKEVKNILESIELEEINRKKDGYYPQWNAKQECESSEAPWVLEAKEKGEKKCQN